MASPFDLQAVLCQAMSRVPGFLRTLWDTGWTIGGIPELAHLSPGERRGLLKAVGSRRVTSQIIAKSLVLGIVIGALAAAAGSNLLLKGKHDAMLAAAAIPAATLLMYRMFILKVRVQLRGELMRGCEGSHVPVCLACGYNLLAATGDRCPECGAPVAVKRSRLMSDPASPVDSP